ncbi:MAG: response regulator [Schwartzia sp.]|nr:response regulator [Schwartzia sp. (in: firmicutes)]
MIPENEFTILIIDDDEINCEMAKTILERNFPYRVLVAMSGRNGLELLLQTEVHLVLLDVTMPGWDGFRTLSAIRAEEKLKDIPVIMLTASADRLSVVKASEGGVVDYIKKPFLPEELVSRVAKAIWSNWQQDGFDMLTKDIEDLLRIDI